jgi:hypothetical protein
MSRARRIKPSTAEGRKRQAELGKIISNPRTPKAERSAALEELDRIAPVEGSGSPAPTGSSLQIREPKPTTRDLLALCDRAKAPLKTTGVSSPVVMSDPAGHRERAIQKAANATPQEKAEVILSELPEHPLNKLARELEQYIWNEDRSNPRPSLDLLSKHRVQHWLSDAPYNRHDLRGNRTTVDAAVSNALKLVADLDSADPSWFVSRAEKLLDVPYAPTKPTVVHESPSAERVKTSPVPSSVQLDEPTLNPIERANIDLAARAALVLQTDSWLSRLAQHSTEMHTRIIAALSDEIIKVGYVSGDVAAKFYNDYRPRALSAFRPRLF